MQRAHLFEFNDLPWLPSPLRKTIMEFLHHMSVRLRMYDGGFDALAGVMERHGLTSIQAMCAGDGGLMLALSRHLGRQDVHIQLSDKYPSLERFAEIERESGGHVSHVKSSVDVLDVPGHLSGLRLIVNAVHHFQPPAVRGILADAVAKQQPIVFLEPVQRDLLSILRFCAATPLISAWLSLGGIRPLNLRRVLLGVVAPLGSLCFLFDGVVSHLRAYHLKEWEALIQQVEGHEGYDWELRQLTGFMGARVSFLAGVPKSRAPVLAP
ncbi:hypothetical protein OV208_41135 [Corallococcus sp. bb12-1]|uniref:hypothetical protein n=1 Tax=Corallococcus sp. bb12-1 TaxID=2996784 RepID=UPI0022711F52|nr:hypothetical protein [Corallococcus sp. bb12-1]MCY1047774.1 hypothetical protein [Corallococcus sp. bb12-1]